MMLLARYFSSDSGAYRMSKLSGKTSKINQSYSTDEESVVSLERTIYFIPDNVPSNQIVFSAVKNICGTFDDVLVYLESGKVDKIIGGSATYVAYAAGNFVTPVQQISIVGYDFPKEEMVELNSRGVQTDGVEIVPDKKSFFWSGKYHIDMNTRDTLVTDLNVLADFNPVVPDSYQGAEFLMLGNLMPKLQLSVINQLKKRPKLIVMDTMNFWMDTALEDLKEVIAKVDVLLVNDGEARQLSGEVSLVKAARKIMGMGPKFLIIKKLWISIIFHAKIVIFYLILLL